MRHHPDARTAQARRFLTVAFAFAALLAGGPADGGEAPFPTDPPFDTPPPFAPASPFMVELKAGVDSARPDDVIPVAVVLDVPETHKLYADSVTFEPALSGVKAPPPEVKADAVTGELRAVYTGRAVFRGTLVAPAAAGESIGLALRVGLQGCSDRACFPPEARELVLSLPLAPEGTTPAPANRELFSEESGSIWTDFTGRGLIVAVVISFLLGIALSATPWVYPLIPVTAAVIGAGAGKKGGARAFALSMIYVLGISITYATLGALAGAGGRRFGEAASHPAVVTTLAVVFLALAASRFAVYELERPSSGQARLRVRAAGGPVGILLMGLLAGLVVSPCIAGPLASVLIYIAKTGEVVRGAAMLFAMAWGMGLILIVAGTFSGLMSRLPKAGGWMVAVKTAFGVVLIVMALYYLRPVLPMWLFTAAVAAPLVAFGLWRGAWTRVPPAASRGRHALRAAGIAALVFGLYFGLGAAIRRGMPAPTLSGLYASDMAPSPSRVKFRSDYADALSLARETKRPTMIDFYTRVCSARKELDAHIFAREDVAKESERFVNIKGDLDGDAAAPGEIARLRVGAAPTVVGLDSAGAVRSALTREGRDVTPAAFLRRLRAVK